MSSKKLILEDVLLIVLGAFYALETIGALITNQDWVWVSLVGFIFISIIILLKRGRINNEKRIEQLTKHNQPCDCDICFYQKKIIKHIDKTCKKMNTYPYPLLLENQRKGFINKFQKELLGELK